MHNLNGDVVTPLFHHLGSSSWHSYDAAMIVSLGKPAFLLRFLAIIVINVFIVLAILSIRYGAFRTDPVHERILMGYGRSGYRKSLSDSQVADRLA